MLNPYQSPRALVPIVNAVELETLRRVAHFQHWAIFALAANVVLHVVAIGYMALGNQPVVASIESAESAVVAISSLSSFIWLLSIIVVYQLVNEMFHVVVAVLCGLLMLLPGICLLTLLVVIQLATGFLESRGVRVGLLGVNPKTI